jgi:hypothetical protein
MLLKWWHIGSIKKTIYNVDIWESRGGEDTDDGLLDCNTM